jgi:hypothetical protein
VKHVRCTPQKYPIYMRGRMFGAIRRLPKLDLSVPPKPSRIKGAGERMTFMAHWRLCQMESPSRGMLRVLD